MACITKGESPLVNTDGWNLERQKLVGALGKWTICDDISCFLYFFKAMYGALIFSESSLGLLFQVE